MTTVAPDRVKIVVVPLDGSGFAVRGLRAGERLARRLGASLLLLSAVSKEEEVDEREEALRGLRPHGTTAEVDVLIDPDPADAIDVVLRDLGPVGVACLASHGRGRSAAILGSVTTEVLRRRREPVVVVGHGYDPDRIDARAGAGVVICVGDMQSAVQVLPDACRWAGVLQEKPIVLTVAEEVPPPLGNRPVRRSFGPDGDVDEFLRRVAALHGDGAPGLETKAVYDPISPVSGLHDHLLLHPAALVAVGSRGRTGLARAILGSVAADFVRESTAPVLVVPRSGGT